MRCAYLKHLQVGQSIVLLSETFAPTIQGEGEHAGQRVGFIRLANCNLACSWCDTPYSWDWKKHDKRTETKEWANNAVASLLREWYIKEFIDRVIITGGEPLMQQSALIEALTGVDAPMKFDIETNGTIVPTNELANLVDLFVVSPKLSHSGDLEGKRLKADPLNTFSAMARRDKAIFKFVITTPKDLDEVEAICAKHGIVDNKVWLMPEGTEPNDILNGLQWLAPLAVKYRWNVSPRLHTLIWGKRRGV